MENHPIYNHNAERLPRQETELKCPRSSIRLLWKLITEMFDRVARFSWIRTLLPFTTSKSTERMNSKMGNLRNSSTIQQLEGCIDQQYPNHTWQNRRTQTISAMLKDIQFQTCPNVHLQSNSFSMWMTSRFHSTKWINLIKWMSLYGALEKLDRPLKCSSYEKTEKYCPRRIPIKIVLIGNNFVLCDNNRTAWLLCWRILKAIGTLRWYFM